MKNRDLPKTHYELIREFLNENNYFGVADFEVLMRALEKECGCSPTFEQFVTTTTVQTFTHLAYSESEAATFANVFYHAFWLYQNHEKIYYVAPQLAAKLADTKLNVDTFFLKAPFKEIYIQIDPGLFQINDGVRDHPVRGFYVNLVERDGIKHVRILVAAIKSGAKKLEYGYDDALFYFRLQLDGGNVDKVLDEYVEQETEKHKEDLRRFGGDRNVMQIKDLFKFVFNVLLYITSRELDIVDQMPPDYAKEIQAKKNPAKKKKLLQRMNKFGSIPIIVIGSRIPKLISSPEEIRAAGGLGKWKLLKKVHVAGYWRKQWYGSKESDDRRAELIYIDDYVKGPELAEMVKSVHRVGRR